MNDKGQLAKQIVALVQARPNDTEECISIVEDMLNFSDKINSFLDEKPQTEQEKAEETKEKIKVAVEYYKTAKCSKGYAILKSGLLPSGYSYRLFNEMLSKTKTQIVFDDKPVVKKRKRRKTRNYSRLTESQIKMFVKMYKDNTPKNVMARMTGVPKNKIDYLEDMMKGKRPKSQLLLNVLGESADQRVKEEKVEVGQDTEVPKKFRWLG